MNMKLTPQDQQMLSAYLDGQLSQREKAHLETRLETYPALREELESLSQTRALLRLTPQRRAPRNYSLKPEWVATRRSKFQWIPALRLSSALASMLAVVAILFNLAPTFNSAIIPAAAPQMTYAYDENVTAESLIESASAEPTPMILIWGSTGMGGLGGVGSGPTNIPDGERNLAPEATPAPVEGFMLEATPVIVDLPPIQGSGPILGIRPTEEVGKIQPDQRESYSAATPKDASTADQSAAGHGARNPNLPTDDTNRWLIPGALLIVALFTGGFSIYLQNKKV